MTFLPVLVVLVTASFISAHRHIQQHVCLYSSEGWEGVSEVYVTVERRSNESGQIPNKFIGKRIDTKVKPNANKFGYVVSAGGGDEVQVELKKGKETFVATWILTGSGDVATFHQWEWDKKGAPVLLSLSANVRHFGMWEAFAHKLSKQKPSEEVLLTAWQEVRQEHLGLEVTLLMDGLRWRSETQNRVEFVYTTKIGGQSKKTTRFVQPCGAVFSQWAIPKRVGQLSIAVFDFGVEVSTKVIDISRVKFIQWKGDYKEAFAKKGDDKEGDHKDGDKKNSSLSSSDEEVGETVFGTYLMLATNHKKSDRTWKSIMVARSDFWDSPTRRWNEGALNDLFERIRLDKGLEADTMESDGSETAGHFPLKLALSIAAVVLILLIAVLDSRYQIGADLSLIMRSVKTFSVLRLGRSQNDMSMADIWARSVQKFRANTFVIFEHKRLTFGEADMMSNQMARWLLAQGFKRGDVIAMLMENRAEFIVWWLAMTKIGIEIAMINCNLKMKGLVHCIEVANAVALLFDAETEPNVFDTEDELDQYKLLFWGGKPTRPFKRVLPVTLTSPFHDEGFKEMRRGIKMGDNFGFIYTSGTTGLPKAAKITHVKMAVAGSLIMSAGMGPEDRLYTCLPLFHSAGGGIGVVGCILTGATLVLARKFSASRFWQEVVEYECTGFLYIGELGRYLVNYAKEHPEVGDMPHKLKMAIGNGLRPEVWDDFQDGFKIPLVVEFYSATEGNGALVNFCQRDDTASRGTVGRAGWLVSKVLKPTIVKFDVETEEVVRGPDGFCQLCAPGEAGELLFPDVGSDPSKSFKGYTDAKSTAKKVLSGAFAAGDSWYRTGDLLSKDEHGYFYFIDRTGDTFRWKGQNCSTMEISEVVSSFPGVQEANVYGTKVPSMDGRACMVALTSNPNPFDQVQLDALQQLCAKELPSYSQPLFLRFLPEQEITGTFKHQKVRLREQGCDPNLVSDEMFWLCPQSKKYEPFGVVEHQILQNGQSKL